MRGVILAAGIGTRMRPYTFSKPKHLLPVANKPVIQYVVESLKNADVTDITVVVGHLQSGIRGYLGDGSRFGVRISYVEQADRKGLAHAVSLAENEVDEGFIVILGDILFTSGLRDIIDRHEKEGAEATLGLAKVKDPSALGVVEMEGSEIRRLVEKPKVPPSDLAIAGIYVFRSKEIFKVISGLKASARGEYEITDAVQGLIDAGKKVSGVEMGKWWKDTGNPEDLLDANKMMMDELLGKGEERVGKSSKVDADLEGPCIIGEDCRIKGSRIGPYACIGDKNDINGCDIRNSILMEGSKISGTIIKDSIIGSDCSFSSSGKKEYRLYIGDMSRIDAK